MNLKMKSMLTIYTAVFRSGCPSLTGVGPIALLILLVLSGPGGGAIRAQTFSPVSTPLPSGLNTNVEVADFDNDNYPDLVITVDGPPRNSRLFRNAGNNSFREISAGLTGVATVSKNSMAWGDYDNNGLVDLFLSGYTGLTGFAGIYANRSGSPQVFELLPQEVRGQLNGSACWADFDNDGDADLFFTGTSPDAAGVYRNDGDGVFVFCRSNIAPIWFGSVSCADYDKDGDIDILLVGWNNTGPTAHVYRNDGDLEFHDAGVDLPGIWDGVGLWGDYDNDGSLDILLSGHCGPIGVTVPVARLYHNDGSGTYSEVPSNFAPTAYSAGVWGDFDNDGWLDVALMGRPPNEIKIYRNNTEGTFIDINAGLYGAERAGLQCADFDNDGDLDLFSSADARLYRNDITRINSRPSAPTHLESTVLHDSVNGSTVLLQWHRASDAETPAMGLSYNMRVGRSQGAIDILSPLAHTGTGQRRVVQMGNVSQDSSWHIRNLKRGRYYWSVQTIDHSFAGSPFATESTFSIPDHLPVITSVPESSTTEGSSYVYEPSARDFDGDAIVFRLQTDAEFLDIDSLTGRIDGQIPGFRTGQYPVMLVADDRHGGLARQSFTLQVGPGRPLEFFLHQNFPNPFNPVTTIRYQLPAEGLVTMTIYNTTGQRVRTLVRGEESFGFRSAVWNGRDDENHLVASGVYFCVFTYVPRVVGGLHTQASSFRRVQKMLILR